MFVRMIKAATAEQLGAVRERAVAAGLAVYEEQGATGSTLAILGPSGVSATLEQEFAALPGVASAKRATRPYRLASREFRDAPTVVKVRDAVIGGGSLTLMAGPCSIESRDQLFEVAQGVADAGATLLRGGAFKPRTSPYTFQGLGKPALEILAEATNVIAEGEVHQLMNMHDASLDEQAYLRVIRAKTAKLFEASSRLAAILAGADAQTEAHCADYGQALGAAFQIIDDVLDYEGDTAELGKNLGDDLREGKVTLPVICTLQRCSADEAALIREAIEQGNTERLDEISAIVRRCGGLDDARRAAQVEAQRAVDAARALPVNLWSQAMAEFAASLLERRA